MPFIPLQKWGTRFPGPPITQVRNLRGGVTTQEIILAGGTKGVIRTQNFVTATSGWAAYGDGSAEFAGTVLIGGTLTVGDTASDHIILDGSQGQIQFWGSGIDNEGLLYSVAEVLFIEPPRDSSGSNAKGALALYGDASGAYGVQVTVGGSTTNKMLYSFGVQTNANYQSQGGAYFPSSSSIRSIGLGGTASDPDAEWIGSNPGGFMTKQTDGYLPAMEYASLTDLTTISASTWTTVDAASRPFILHGLRSNKVRAFAEANVIVDNTSGSGTTLARARMRISLDGGATWTNGKAARVDVAAGARASLHPGQQLNGTPTGNIVAELQVLSTDTATDFTAAWARVQAFGDL